MATEKTEQSDTEELVHYQHPDGHWEEMTKPRAEALAKEQSKKAKDWKEEIKTRSE